GNSITIGQLNGGGGGNGFIDNTSATPVALTVNTANDCNFDGVIQDGGTGAMSLVKSGAGKLTLNSSNAYTGTTTITAGTLQISSGGGDGTLAPSTTITGTGGTLSLNRGDNTSFSIPTSGNISLSKENNSVLTMPSTYSYTGVTAIQSGTLLVTGQLPSGGTV